MFLFKNMSKSLLIFIVFIVAEIPFSAIGKTNTPIYSILSSNDSLVKRYDSMPVPNKKPLFTLGVDLGMTAIQGDIRNFNVIPGRARWHKTLRKQYSYYIQRNFYKEFDAKFEFSRGGLKGSKMPADERAIAFLCDYNLFTLSVVVDGSYFFKSLSTKHFDFNVSLGAGLISYRSVSWYYINGRMIEMHGYKLEDDANIKDGEFLSEIKKSKMVNKLAVPVQANASYRINDRTSLCTTISLTLTNSDALDGKSEGAFGMDKISYVGLGFKYNLFLHK